MKTTTALFVALSCAASCLVRGQDAPTVPPPDPSQLNQLLSPIALYPDPLLAAILPAATHPAEVASAASFVGGNADPNIIDQQPWDDSVKELAHYPDVVAWLAQNSAWTNQLGAAVLAEQPQVLDAIQQLRANARASGLLVDTPQQRVVMNGNVISIEPAQPGTVYVPMYDPQSVVMTTPSPRFGVSFGTAYSLGPWAMFGLDWRDHSLWIDRNHTMQVPRDRDRYTANTDRGREIWRPNPESAPRPAYRRTMPYSRVPQPTRYSEHAGNWRQSPALAPTGRTPTWNGRENERTRTDDRRTYPGPQVAPGEGNRARADRDRRDDDDHPQDR